MRKLLRIIKFYFLCEKRGFRLDKSYTVYKYCLFFIFVPSLVLFFFSSNLYHFYIHNIIYLLLPLIIFGFLIDVWWIAKNLYNTVLGKFIYAVLGYFAYGLSMALAKETIFLNTYSNPNDYDISIYVLSGILLIPSWIFLINIFIILFLFISHIILLVYIVLQIIFPKMENKIILYIKSNTVPKKKHLISRGRFLIKFIFFIFGALICGMLSLKVVEPINQIQSSNFIKHLILRISYFPNIVNPKNNKKICDNENIKVNSYIKLLDSGDVSVTNYEPLDFFLGKNKLEFETMKCSK